MNINNSRRLILICGLLAFCLICVSPALAAQDKVRGNQAKPDSCEVAMLYLDNSASEAGKDSEGHIIAVARLGDDEQSARLNRQRLEFVGNYLINGRGWNKIVIAVGERVRGKGRVELYVGGKLLYVLRYPRRGLISCADLG
jgi:hypothetical protein